MNAKKNKSLLPLYLKGLIIGKYTLSQASVSTGYSKNWLCVLKRKYLQHGFDFSLFIFIRKKNQCIKKERVHIHMHIYKFKFISFLFISNSILFYSFHFYSDKRFFFRSLSLTFAHFRSLSLSRKRDKIFAFCHF